jgi:multicomponent Na+:H+ antiporter subunit D
MIGAASISAFPFFSGFISKSMTVTAVAEEHQVIVWLMLLFASAGVFHHAGIKVPYFIFFGHDSGIRSKEPPVNMRVAMGIAAFICIFLGLYPAPLYSILPYPVDFQPYTVFHVIGMLQLLMFGALAFTLLILSGYYPAELRAVNLDTDWFVRLPGRKFIMFCRIPLKHLFDFMDRSVMRAVGVLKSSPRWAVTSEKGADSFFHIGLTSIPDIIYTWTRYLQTEIKQLSLNLTYILIFFIVLLFIMLYLAR